MPISGFPSKEGLKPATTQIAALNAAKAHFGISIKRRIETENKSRWQRYSKRPISGFPSKEGLKRVSMLVKFKSNPPPFRDFHQKKDWNHSPWSRLGRKQYFPFRDFHQKKDWNKLCFPQNYPNLYCPFRDFHQKKDWNPKLFCEEYPRLPTHFGISIKRRIETHHSKGVAIHHTDPFRDFHQKKDWNNDQRGTVF